MPLNKKVLQLAQSELSADLARLRREHVEELREIARNPQRHGPHLRSRTHGQVIFDEICKTYRQRAEAIHDALTRALRFQEGQPFTAEELATAFNELFEPERSDTLEHSRSRLAEIRNGSFINDTVTEANRLLVWYRSKAEHVVADHDARSRESAVVAEVSRAITGSGALIAGDATVVAFGRADSRADLDRAAEVSRELERLHPILETLTDRELSAYSTKSLSIGTFLHTKGHAFSVLTEDMLAEQFREELERRKAERREGWRSSLRSPTTFFLFISAIVGLLGVLATCLGP